MSCGRARGACPSICGRPLGPLSGESAARCHGADAPRPQTVGRHVASAFVFVEGGLAALTSAALSTRFLLRKCRVPGRIERNAVRKAFSFRLWRAAWWPVAPTLAQARRSGSSAVPHCGPGLGPGAPDRLLVHVTRVHPTACHRGAGLHLASSLQRMKSEPECGVTAEFRGHGRHTRGLGLHWAPEAAPLKSLMIKRERM